MAGKLYTISGAAEYKGTTYPTIKKAIDGKKLVPLVANAGLRKVQEVKLLTGEALDAWTPRRASRLTDEQRIERAAKVLGITPAQMKAALAKKR